MVFLELYWFELSTAVVAMGLLTYTLVLSRRLKSYKKMTTLLKGGNLEEHICTMDERLQKQENFLKDLNGNLKALEKELAAYPHRWHLMRYNAFDKTGSDLSFTLALLNDQANGVVLTSIFGREDSRLYAKPVAGGKSEYTLSDEEKQAIKASMSTKNR